MIVEAALEVLFAPLVALLELLPSFTLPEWFNGGSADCGTGGPAGSPGATEDRLGCYAYFLGQRIAWLDAWVPTGHLFTMVAFVAVAIGVCLAVRAVRSLVSLVTGGGGA